MFDFDLARMYEVETRVLNQAVKRNIELFPKDFMFPLTKEEWNFMSSQIVITYPEKRPKTALPLVFTEHGVTMLANVLKSKKARLMSVTVVRAFIALKEFALNYAELAHKIKELEIKYDKNFIDIYQAINYLVEKDKKQISQEDRRRIGYGEKYD
jgi:hypothetical protein